MQLAILAAVLAALAATQSGGEPVPDVAWRLLLVAIAPLVAPLAALVGARRLVLAPQVGEMREDILHWLHAVVVGLWLATVAIMLFVAQWPRIVTSNWQLGSWPLVDELVILAPVIGSLLLVWTAFYQLERSAQTAHCRVRGLDLPPGHLARYLWLRARHYLGLILLPPLIIIAVFESLAALKIIAGNLDTAWWLVLPMVVTMLVLMPIAVRRIWRTTPLALGPLRESLEAICLARNCTIRDILVWHTHGTMANAAVVGMSRWLRYVLLTDALLDRLSPEEIAAVVRHELAHLRRWHLPLRLALLTLPLAVWLAIKHRWPSLESAGSWVTGGPGASSPVVAMLGAPLAMLAYAVIVVGRYSRLLEHDADLDACLADHGRIDPQWANDFRRALIGVCGESRTDYLSEWLHPPLWSRLKFLERAAHEEAYATRFRKRLWWFAAAIAAGFLASASLLAV